MRLFPPRSRRSPRHIHSLAIPGHRDLQFTLPESSTNLGTVFGSAGAIYMIGGLALMCLLSLRPPGAFLSPPLVLQPAKLPAFLLENVIGAGPSGGTRGGGNQSRPLEPLKTAPEIVTRPPDPLPQAAPVEQLVPQPELTPAAIVPMITSDSPLAMLGPNAPNSNALGTGRNGAGGAADSGVGVKDKGASGIGDGPGGIGDPDGSGGNGVDVQVTPVFTPKPGYTAEAMSRRIEGEVRLSCVVLASGRVGSCRITKSLDANYGLDQEALKTASKFVFTPARRKGQPVPVTVNIVLEFNMR
jgi:TonB family protein